MRNRPLIRLNRTLLFMGLLAWFCSIGAKPTTAQALRTIRSDSREFTTGAEEIIMPLPKIAFIPPPGWSPFTGVKGEQKPTDVRIANPSLLGKAGMITCILFPADGLSVTERIDNLLSKLPDRVVERADRPTASGLPVTFVHTAGPVPGKSTEKHTMHCFFKNGDGQVVDLYCIGSAEADARTTSDAFFKSLRLVP